MLESPVYFDASEQAHSRRHCLTGAPGPLNSFKRSPTTQRKEEDNFEESRSVLSKVDWSGKLRQMELKDVLDIDLASMRRSVNDE